MYLWQSPSIHYGSRKPDCVTETIQLSKEESLCNHVTVFVNNSIIEELPKANYISIFPTSTKVSTKWQIEATRNLPNRMRIQHWTRQIYQYRWDIDLDELHKPQEEEHRLHRIETVEVCYTNILFWIAPLHVVILANLRRFIYRFRRQLSCQKTTKANNREPVQAEYNPVLCIPHRTLYSVKGVILQVNSRW